MIFNKIRFNKSYSIFSWGNTRAALGHKSDKNTPQKIEWPQQTGQKIHQIEFGSSHSAIIDEQGKLYTFGSNKYGELGHNDGNNNIESIPREVQFFSKNDLKVKQILCLNQSSIAITTDGDVWSWGYGGRNVNWITKLFYQNCAALGHNNNEHRFCPTPIQSLRKQAKTKYLTGGNDFVISINKNNEIFNWGVGEFGVLGDGKNKNYNEPKKNEVLMNIGQMEDKKEIDQNQKLIEIKSIAEWSIGLDNRNQLWGWGGNYYGQLGTNVEIGVEMHETMMFPTKVHNDPLSDKTIKDFQLGENSMAVLLEDGSVFWSGMKINYILAQLHIPKLLTVKQITASHMTVAVLTDDNQIYMKNNYVNHHHENIETGVLHADGHKLFAGNIVQIGGGYRNRYAIVEND